MTIKKGEPIVATEVVDALNKKADLTNASQTITAAGLVGNLTGNVNSAGTSYKVYGAIFN